MLLEWAWQSGWAVAVMEMGGGWGWLPGSFGGVQCYMRQQLCPCAPATLGTIKRLVAVQADMCEMLCTCAIVFRQPQEHPELSEAHVHLGMLSAAKAVLQVRATPRCTSSSPTGIAIPCAGVLYVLLTCPHAHAHHSTCSCCPLTMPPQDLNKHQILPILLTGQPLAAEEQLRQRSLHTLSEEQQERYSQLTRPAAERGRGQGRLVWHGQPGNSAGTANRSPTAAGHAAAAMGSSGRQQGQNEADEADEELEDRLSPEDFQSLLQQRGLDCRGWKLVVAAHSLGAAVAALVGIHFRSFAPGG